MVLKTSVGNSKYSIFGFEIGLRMSNYEVMHCEVHIQSDNSGTADIRAKFLYAVLVTKE